MGDSDKSSAAKMTSRAAEALKTANQHGSTKAAAKREESAVKKMERERAKQGKMALDVERKEKNTLQRRMNKCMDSEAELHLVSCLQVDFVDTVDRAFGQSPPGLRYNA